MADTAGYRHGITISIPEALVVENKQAGENFIVYTVELNGPGSFFYQIKKRFNEFREFDKGWQSVYPGLHETYRLPTAKLRKNFTKKKDVLTEERREGIQSYLVGIAGVISLHPLLAQFLQLPTNTFDTRKQSTADEFDERVSIVGDSWLKGNQCQAKYSDGGWYNAVVTNVLGDNTFQVKFQTIDETATVNGSELKPREEIDDDARRDIQTEDLGLKKGNTDLAAKQAEAAKRAFMEKNADLIASLMPGNNFNLPQEDASAIQKAKRKIFKGGAAEDDDVLWTAGTGARVSVPYTPDETEMDCLLLEQGCVIKIWEETTVDWWYGALKDGTEGYFPSQCVKRIKNQQMSDWKKLILDSGSVAGIIRLDYVPNKDEAGDNQNVLTVKDGQHCTIMGIANDDWWMAQLPDTSQGYVPAACVHLITDPEAAQFSWTIAVPTLYKPLSELKPQLSLGEQFTKYAPAGSTSQQHLYWRPLADSETDMGILFWVIPEKKNQQGAMTGFLRLQDITLMMMGKQTASFQKKVAQKAALAHCFSIVYTDMKTAKPVTLDLEATTPANREKWLAALCEIIKISKSHSKIIAILPQADLSSLEHDLSEPGAPVPRGATSPKGFRGGMANFKSRGLPSFPSRAKS